jgi:hypothetical protein
MIITNNFTEIVFFTCVGTFCILQMVTQLCLSSCDDNLLFQYIFCVEQENTFHSCETVTNFVQVLTDVFKPFIYDHNMKKTA